MVVHRAMLKRIYNWCIDAAHKPYALWIMGAVSFAEKGRLHPYRQRRGTKVRVAILVLQPVACRLLRTPAT